MTSKLLRAYSIITLLLATLFLLLFQPLSAQFGTPTIDGTISPTEYGAHTDGQNQQTSGATVTYLTWDDTNLYIAISTANVFEGAVFYIDINPLSPTNGGTDADGSLVGQNYDNTNFATLPFRADFVAYYKNGYREYRTADGSNGWSAQTAAFGTYADNGTTIREIAIPWSDITSGVTGLSGSDRPASFAFFQYVTSAGGFVYGQVPAANDGGLIGTTADYPHYYQVSSTGDGTSTPPFSDEHNVYADQMLINEFTPKGTEWVELYNTTAATVTLTGWYLIDADCGTGTSFIGAQDIGPGGFFVVGSGDPGDNFNLDNTGDQIVLCDSSDTEIDRASYGINGAAPIGPLASGGPQYSTARINNGQDTNDDAADWNIDVSPTQGTANDVPLNDLGGSLLINEIDVFPVSGNDMIELYNPTTQTVTVTNWFISDGDDVAILSGTLVLPPGGFLALEENVDWTTEGSTGVDFASTDVAYLFNTARVRVDQLGWTGEFEDDCFARVPNGAGPNDGYNWATSGGDITLLDQPCTLGASNSSSDVTISKTGPTVAQPGEQISYTILYQNSGTEVATTVLLTDTLPPTYATYLSDNSGLACPACIPGTAGPLAWTVGTLSTTTSVSFTLVVSVSDSTPFGTILTNTAVITTDSPDSDPTNNTSQWPLAISALDLSVSKDGPAVALSGQPLVYTITVQNQGVATATNVLLTDTLPANSTYVSDDSGWACPACVPGPAAVLTWSAGPLANNTLTSFNVTITVDISPTTNLTVTNAVTISTDTPGDNPANNSDTATTILWNIVPIATARAGSDGEVFGIEGQVIYVPGTYNSSGWGLQDNSGGIGVFYNPPPAVSLGDFVRLVATRGSFSGEEQMTSPVLTFDNLGSGPLVTPTPYTTGDVTAGLSEGWLVVISGTVSNLTCPAPFNHTFNVDDGSGATDVFVDGTTGIDTCALGVQNGLQVRVVGFSTEFNGTFQVKPRFPADITLFADEPIISKSALGIVGPNELYTYTLTVENYLGYTLTAPIIADVVPFNATFAYVLDGGTTVMSGTQTVVAWPTLPDLPDQSTLNVRFAVTSTNVITTIVNEIYGINALNYPTPTYGSPITTLVSLPLRIRDLHGPGHFSPLDGLTVQDIYGIVTAVEGSSFYMQDPNPDLDNATSEAIVVFTGGAPGVNVGDAVLVSGEVSEFYPGGVGTGNLSTTELTNASVVISATNQPLPPPVIIGTNGRIPPAQIIDDDANGDVNTSGTFDPDTDGIDFYESLESMLVQVENAIVVGSNRFGETQIVGDNGAHAGLFTPRGGLVIQSDDFNPERIILDDAIIAAEPDVTVGDAFTDIITGVLSYSFGNFKLLNAAPLPAINPGGVVSETTPLTGGTDHVTVASMNVENLDPGDANSHFNGLADQIVNHLLAPDIIGLQEVQDNNGPTNDGTVDASLTYQTLITAVLDAGGPLYEFRDIAPQNNMDGGQPGGNIRVGFLFRPDRVTFVDRPGGDATTATTPVVGPSGVELTYSPGRIQPTNVAFTDSRKPLAGEFLFNGSTIIVVNNHFNSKGGDTPLFGRLQPPILNSEVQRLQQAQVVNDFVDSILTLDTAAKVIVLGDLNDFQFSPPLDTLKGGVLDNLIERLPAEEQYTYLFDGNSQVLDHILVSHHLSYTAAIEMDVVHMNAEFDSDFRPTDHDPVLARLHIPPSPFITITTPLDGAVFTATNGVSTTITVAVTTTNFTIPDDGHWHLWRDGTDTGPVYDDMGTVDLTVGTHVISAQLQSPTHVPLGPVDTVVVTVVAPTFPDIFILSPADGSIFTATNGTDVDITLDITITNGFVIPDDGHWHLWLNGTDTGPVYAYTATTTLPVGTHVISAQLQSPTHVPLGPVDTIQVTVVTEPVETQPTIYLPFVVNDVTSLKPPPPTAHTSSLPATTLTLLPILLGLAWLPYRKS